MSNTFQKALTAHNEGDLEEAERLYQIILENQPQNTEIINNLGNLLFDLGRFNEAEIHYRKVIEINPNHNTVYYNLGILLKKVNRLDESENNFRKAIELNPDFINAHLNLGSTLKELSKLDEAVVSFKKTIELKPDYAEAHINLGNILSALGKHDDAESSINKGIELNPDLADAYTLLQNSFTRRVLLDLIKSKKDEEKKKLNFFKKIYKKIFDIFNHDSNSDIYKRLTSAPFISSRKVESELINGLYRLSCKKLNDTKGVFFGKGRHSKNFRLFENDLLILKTVEKDLTSIMKQAVKSDIFISDSFFNILTAGGGSNLHTHIDEFDKAQGLLKKKYSLSYYLSVGDQNCSEPGIFKLHEPNEEILPSDGMIMIFPSTRKHSAVYGGMTDRVLIGINFYSLI